MHTHVMCFLSRDLSKVGFDPKKNIIFRNVKRIIRQEVLMLLLPFRNRIHKSYSRTYTFGHRPTTYYIQFNVTLDTVL